MLEPPPIPLDRISRHLAEARGATVDSLDFLPLGADTHTAVYRAATARGELFVKLRRGPFLTASVTVPAYLASLGIDAVIPPLPDLQGRLGSALDEYAVIVYPFVEGRDAYEVALTDEQRRALGAAARAIHGARLPAAARADAPSETFGPAWRTVASDLLDLAERRGPVPDAVAEEMAAFMRRRARAIRKLIDRAGALAESLARRRPRGVLCHGDLHAGNLHVAGDGRVYIVDWDTLVIAPPERDLMFVGAGIDRVWRGRGAGAAFYRGYGRARVDREALAYYRCERAVEDIAAFGRELLLSDRGGADRAQSLAYFASAFERGGAVPVALNTR
jgi:spectinomycin phosphotransferase